MNKKILIAASIVACMTMGAFAHHHHHDGFWGGFVGGLFGGLFSPRTTVVAQPAPVVVTQPLVAQPVVAQPVVAQPVVAQPVVATPAPVVAIPAPVVQTTAPVVQTTVVAQPPATITYGVYQGISCPTYNGYYFHNNAWRWGGPIHAHRPPPPHWHPHQPPHRPPPHHR